MQKLVYKKTNNLIVNLVVLDPSEDVEWAVPKGHALADPNGQDIGETYDPNWTPPQPPEPIVVEDTI